MIDLPDQWLHLEGEESSGLNCLYSEFKATIKQRPGARREQWLHCPWLRKSCCLVRVAASLKAGEFRPRILKNKWGDHNTGWQGWRILDVRKLQLVDKDQ